MHRRLGQTGIFVEVNGKYYLNEERLKQIQERRAKAGSGSSGSNSTRAPTWFRIVGTLLMLPIGIIIALMLLCFVAPGGGYFPGELLIVFLVIFLGLFVVRLLFWRSRRRQSREHWRENEAVRILHERYAHGEITGAIRSNVPRP